MNFLRNNIVSRFFRRVTRGVRTVTRTVSRVTGIGNAYEEQSEYGSGRGRRRGLKGANRNNVDKSKVKNQSTGYIDKVDNFSKEPEPENIRPVYHYGKTAGDANIGKGYAGLGETMEESSNEVGLVDEETKDLWETPPLTEEDEEFYRENIKSVEEEDTTTRNEIIKFYMDVMEGKHEDEKIKETDRIIKEVYKQIPLNDITHVPHFLENVDKMTNELKESIKPQLSEEFKDQVVEQEMARYRNIVNDFLEVTEKDGKHFLNDWKFGIKTVDFLVKAGRVPEIMLLLTPFELDEVVKVMRTGYMPEVIQETPFGKIAYIFEGVTRNMVSDTGSSEYNFPGAYEAYKRRLPMYKKLRNNGNLANVNTVLKYFYHVIDRVHINEGAEGDVYLGLIEPHEFINAYLQFFYGKAKQTHAMSEFSLKMMKKNPQVMKRVNDRGLAVADKPEDTLLSISGHIVVLAKVKNETYNLMLDKAPSDIKGEDINNIAGMFDQEDKKSTPKKSTPSKQEPKDEFGLSYDYDGAMKKIREDKANKRKKRK